MEQRTEEALSPYRAFSREQWAALREDTPMTLTSNEVTRLRSLHDRLDMKEVEDIYLPLSRLLSMYVAATQRLFRAQQRFLGTEDSKMPYVIGVAGSVAVGKSTTARVLQALLARWPNVPKVDLITTDGFLYPNAVLEREGLMEKKGFPESYDLPALLRFLTDVKAGRRPARAPIYSHLIYDVIPNQWVEVDRPDILIVEGLNVLQTGRLPKDGKAIPFVSDFFDFSVYLDADRRDPARLVYRPLSHLARHRLPRPEVLLPPLFEPVGRRSDGDRGVDLGEHQPGQPARKHIADPPARRPDPEEKGGSHGGGSVAAAVVSSSVFGLVIAGLVRDPAYERTVPH